MILAYRQHPSLLLALISNLNQQSSQLVTSVRLAPLQFRRDVLIFTDPAREHGLHILPDLALLPRLSFPSGPVAAEPDLTLHANRSRRDSRRSIRVRPASLASLNGGPLLPSIPASPSWEEEDGRLPSGIHQRVPATAGPRLETDSRSYFSGPFPPTERKHKKSSSMPGNATNGWSKASHPNRPNRDRLDNCFDVTEILRDSPDNAQDHPNAFSPSQTTSASEPTKSTGGAFISNGNIEVKAVTASPVVSGPDYRQPGTAPRINEVPDRGTISSQGIPGSGSSSESGNRTATSSLKKESRPVIVKAADKRRGGLRSLLKALF